MSRLAVEEIMAIPGKRGMGKSTEAKKVCAAELQAGARCAAFDYHDEYSVHGDTNDGVVTLGPLSQRCTVDQLLDRPELMDEPRLSLAIVPRAGSPVYVAGQFKEVHSVWVNTGRFTAFVDELGRFARYAADQLADLATQSRHYKIPLVLASQRMVHIPADARSQVTEMRCFRQTHPADLKAIYELTGSEDFAARVPRLRKHEKLKWRDDQPQEEQTQ